MRSTALGMALAAAIVIAGRSPARASTNEVTGIHYSYHSGFSRICYGESLDVDRTGTMLREGDCDDPKKGTFAGQLPDLQRRMLFGIAAMLDWDRQERALSIMDSASQSLSVDYASGTKSIYITAAEPDFAHLMRMLREIQGDDTQWDRVLTKGSKNR